MAAAPGDTVYIRGGTYRFSGTTATVGVSFTKSGQSGKPIRYFAFPYGLHANLNAEAFRLARRAGYQGACSAYGGYNWPGDDHFHLQRIHADPEMLRLKNWLTSDLMDTPTISTFFSNSMSDTTSRKWRAVK